VIVHGRLDRKLDSFGSKAREAAKDATGADLD
jgi:hypothetical protein